MLIKAKNQEGSLIFTALAKNKAEARELILSDKRMQEIKTIEYGKKIYTLSDVYGRF